MTGRTLMLLCVPDDKVNQLCVLAGQNQSTVVEQHPQVNDVWGEDLEFPRKQWQAEVVNSETSRGYWSWAAAKREERTAVELRLDEHDLTAMKEMYAVGVAVDGDVKGCTHGPFPELKQCLNVIPTESNSVIVAFNKDEDGNDDDTSIVYRWEDDRWVEVIDD